MSKKEMYRLDLVIGVNGDGDAKNKLKVTEKYAQKTEKSLKNLDRIKVSPSAKLNDKVSSVIDKITKKSKLLNKVFTSTARVNDRATPILDRLKGKVGIFNKPVDMLINARDSTNSAISSVKAKIQNLKAATIISLNIKADPAIRAISLTRTKLGELSSKLSSMAGKTYQAIVNLKDNVSPTLQSLDGKINTFTKGVVTKFATIATAGAVAFGGIGVSASVKGFADFEQGMKNVQAVSGATSTEMEQLTATAREMGRTTAFTSKDAASALEYMGMAGWKTNDMISGLPGILNLASAGSVDLGVASDIVTDGLTAMGLTAKDTNDYVDIMAATITNSNTSVELMGETMKYVGSVGGALGVDMKDLSLAIGLMGNASIKGSQAGTALRGGLTRLIKPPKEAANAMKKYGIEIQKTQDGNLDLAGTMNELRNKLSGLDATTQGSALAMIFGQEAMAGWAAVVNASEEDFNKLSGAIEESSGKAKEVSDIKLQSLSGQFELLKSAVDDVKLSLGERLAPYTKDFVQWMTSKMPEIADTVVKIVDTITTNIPKIAKVFQDVLPIIAGVIASFVAFKVMMTGMTIITTIVPIIKNVVSAIGLFVGGAGTLGEAMALLMGPIGWIAIGIGLLVGAFVLAYQKSETFRNKVNEVGQAIMSFLGPVLIFIKDKLTELGSKFMELLGKLAPLGSALMELGSLIINALGPVIAFVASVFVGGLSVAFSTVINIISSVITAIGGVIEGLTSVISGIVDFITGVFTGNWSQAWEGVKSIFSGVVTAIGGIIEGFIELLFSPVQAILDVGRQLGRNLLIGIGEALEGSGLPFSDKIGGWIKGLGEKIPETKQKGSDVGSSLVDGVKQGMNEDIPTDNLAANINNSMQATQETTKQSGVDVGNNLVNGVAQGVNNGMPVIDGAMNNIASSVQNGNQSTNEAIGGIENILDNGISSVQDKSSQLVTTTSEAVTGVDTELAALNTQFQETTNSVQELATNMITAIQETFSGLAEIGAKAGMDLSEGIKGSLTTLSTDILPIIQQGFSGLAQIGAQAGADLSNGFGTSLNTLSTNVKVAASAMYNGASTSFRMLASTGKQEMSNLYNGATTSANMLATNVKVACTNMYNGSKTSFTSLSTSATSTITSMCSAVTSKVSAMASSVISQWNSIRSTVSKPITASFNVTTTQTTVKKSVDGGSSNTTTKHATGGIFTTPHYALFAEEAGGEAVIPLNGKRRDRAISLWQETGQKLGMDTEDRYRNAGNKSSYFTKANNSSTKHKEKPDYDVDDDGPPNPYYGFEPYSPQVNVAGGSSYDINVEVSNRFDSDIDKEYIIDETCNKVGVKLREAFKNIKR